MSYDVVCLQTALFENGYIVWFLLRHAIASFELMEIFTDGHSKKWKFLKLVFRFPKCMIFKNSKKRACSH